MIDRLEAVELTCDRGQTVREGMLLPIDHFVAQQNGILGLVDSQVGANPWPQRFVHVADAAYPGQTNPIPFAGGAIHSLAEAQSSASQQKHDHGTRRCLNLWPRTRRSQRICGPFCAPKKQPCASLTNGGTHAGVG